MQECALVSPCEGWKMLNPKQLEWVRKLAGLGRDALVESPNGAGEDGSGAGVADLPKSMLPDCTVARGVIPGPDNFVLCSMHGHILDTASKQIVANNLKEFLERHPEYGKLPMDMLTDCAPEHGKLKAPKHHVLWRTHGHVLDTKAGKVIAYSPADYRKRFAPSKAEAAAGLEKGSPPFDERAAQEKLRNILSGAAIFINEFQSRQADFNKGIDSLSNLCGDAVSKVRRAMAEAIAALRAHNETAAQWIARSDLWVPADIPSKSQAARNALGAFEGALDKLRICVSNPPSPPPLGPPPSGVDPAAYKAQQELIHRRDTLTAPTTLENAGSKSIVELVGKIDHELEMAKNLASRMQFAR